MGRVASHTIYHPSSLVIMVASDSPTDRPTDGAGCQDAGRVLDNPRKNSLNGGHWRHQNEANGGRAATKTNPISDRDHFSNFKCSRELRRICLARDGRGDPRGVLGRGRDAELGDGRNGRWIEEAGCWPESARNEAKKPRQQGAERTHGILGKVGRVG